jgi:hypothetical protein
MYGGVETAEVLLQDEKVEELRVTPLHVNQPRHGEEGQEQPAPGLKKGFQGRRTGILTEN